MRALKTMRDDSGFEQQPFIAHLVELRSRVIKSLIVLGAVFLGLTFKANDIYVLFSVPLTKNLPPEFHMIATGVASPFLAPLKLVLFLAVVLSIPFVLYQAWSFVAPGLYRHERKLAFPLLFSSVFLFYLGMAFAFFAVLPIVFKFLVMTTPPGVAVMTDINQYMDFVLTLFFAFGLCFEVPILTILLVIGGIMDRDAIAEKRPYVIVLAFVVGAILTPPDVVSQTMLAVPIWLLFELGLFFTKFLKARAHPSLVAH